MSPNAKPSCNIIFFFLFLTVSFAVSDQKPTAYDAVKRYNLPPGILPKGVVDYELNTTTGDFKVYFNDTCEFTIQSYQLKYKSTISGVISPSHVKNLKGVSVKVLFSGLILLKFLLTATISISPSESRRRVFRPLILWRVLSVVVGLIVMGFHFLLESVGPCVILNKKAFSYDL